MLKNLLCLLLILASIKGYTQESVTFKTEVKPDKNYKLTITTASKSAIKIIADEETLAKMPGGSDMAIDSESLTATEMVTGRRDGSGEFPVTVDYRKMITETTVNGVTTSTENPFTGMRLLGRYDINNKLRLDSVVGNQVEASIKQSMMSVVTSLQEQISFPEKPMKVGDRFQSVLPMNLPMAGMDPVEMKIETEYLLTGIRAGIAHFDLIQSITLDMSSPEFDIAASGSGSGTMEFNIAESHPTNYRTELPLDMRLTVNDNLTMNFKTNMITEQVVVIE